VRDPIPTIPGPRRIHGLDPALAQFRLARDPLGRMSELFERYGAPVSLIRGGGGRVFSGDPGCPGVVFVRGRELIRDIELNHEHFHRSALTGQLTPAEPASERTQPILEWGTGLFAVNGDEHRRHRRLLSPFFTRSRVESYHEEMVRATGAVLGRWQPGAALDLHREMMDLTVRISARALLGLDMDADQDIVRAGAESLRLVLSPWALIAPWDLPGLPYRRFVNAVQFFNKRLKEVIEGRRRAQPWQRDVLTELIHARDDEGQLSDAEVVGHASVIYAASHETTGNALTWAFFLLSQHPDWYRAACDEVRSTLACDTPTLGELERLQVLDGVIRETLRLIPPAPWTTRIAAADAAVGGHHVPRGTEIVLSIFHTHRAEGCYENPDRFDPSRWRRIRPDVFEFNAFSAGTRACIGSGFALLEMKTVLAMALRHFRMEFDPRWRVDPVLNITMAPRAGLKMIVRSDQNFQVGVGGVRGRIRTLVSFNRSEST
jgi:cytochrome P450